MPTARKRYRPRQQAASDLMDDAALADYLGVSPRTPAGYRARGEGPPWITVGQLVRYRRADVDAWLARNTYDPSAAR